jgi:hypothetical protein
VLLEPASIRYFGLSPNMLPKSGRRAPGPHYDLEAFKAEVRAGNVHVYRGRAIDIIRELRKCSQREARQYAKDAVLSLTVHDYAHSIETHAGQVHDVYGMVLQEEGWYLKIEINVDDGQPGIVSCHPAEYDLQTRGGIVPGIKRGRLK